MFFDKITELPKIAQKTSCSIFVIPKESKFKLPSALYLTPDEDKKTEIITVEQIRNFLELTQCRESRDRFFVINPADAMNEAAQNAFLKTFEEPHDFCHFVLITENPTNLLPTILSRAQVFILRQQNRLNNPPAVKPKNLELAKKLIAATPRDLPALAAEIAKSKTARSLATDACAAAIELLYKSYFKTGNSKFLAKLPNFIHLHQNLQQNGHVKLHIVADLC